MADLQELLFETDRTEDDELASYELYAHEIPQHFFLAHVLWDKINNSPYKNIKVNIPKFLYAHTKLYNPQKEKDFMDCLKDKNYSFPFGYMKLIHDSVYGHDKSINMTHLLSFTFGKLSNVNKDSSCGKKYISFSQDYLTTDELNFAYSPYNPAPNLFQTYGLNKESADMKFMQNVLVQAIFEGKLIPHYYYDMVIVEEGSYPKENYCHKLLECRNSWETLWNKK